MILFVVVFFFFKQKTAYEIYQCDWSSDVCSSDLEEEADRSLTLKGEKPNCNCNGEINITLGKPYCVYRYIPAKMEKILYKKKYTNVLYAVVLNR